MGYDFPSLVSGVFSALSEFLLSPPVSYFVGLWLVSVILAILSKYIFR